MAPSSTMTMTSETKAPPHPDLRKAQDGYSVNNIPYISTDGLEQNPGIANATLASTVEKPNGTTEQNWAGQHQDQTVLQQHSAYFDPDHDGVIWPWDIYNGTRNWGWNPLLAFIATFIISGGLSYPTSDSFFPDPFFRIHIPKVHRTKHGSSSMTIDNAGRFRSQRFEEFFDKYDRGHKGGLTKGDLYQAWIGQRMVFDFFGWSAFVFEWTGLWLLIWPEDGMLHKEEVRMSYDGSLFQFKADEYKRKSQGVKQKRLV